MYQLATVAQANLTDAKVAPNLIDVVLKECLLQSRPVYTEIPTDMGKTKVAAAVPYQSSTSLCKDTTNISRMKIVDSVLTGIYGARQPLILVYGFTAMFGVRNEVNELPSQ